MGLGLIAALSWKNLSLSSWCSDNLDSFFSFLFPVTLHTRTAHVFDMGTMIFRTVLFLALSVAFLQFVKCQDENGGKLLFIYEANCADAKAVAFDLGIMTWD